MEDAAKSIQRRMEDVRTRLDEDVDEAVGSARQMVNWHAYVRRYPWACLGLAAVAGYLLVPRRLELSSPDADTLLELARKNKLVIEANPTPLKRNSLAGKLIGLAGHVAVREALTYFGRKRKTAGKKSAVEER